MPHFEDYLFRTHSEFDIKRWATSLLYFRFCRAYGGHSNDGDQFIAALCYDSESDLIFIFESMGLQPRYLAPNHERPVRGQQYSMDEFSKFKTSIHEFPRLEQPGYCAIFGEKVFVWAADGVLKLGVFGAGGDPYEVSEEDFLRAKRIEPHLSIHESRISDPPQDNRNCISPKYYPKYWHTDA
jgi:hypothetical protein